MQRGRARCSRPSVFSGTSSNLFYAKSGKAREEKLVSEEGLSLLAPTKQEMESNKGGKMRDSGGARERQIREA